MQHDHVLKKVEFLLFDQAPGLGRGGGGGLQAKYSDHVAAFVIPFNLICNMTVLNFKVEF